jgi:NAD+ kinase
MITKDTLSSIADAVEAAVAKIPSSAERGAEVCMGADGTPTSQIDKVAENAALMHIQLNSIPLNVLSEEIGFVDNGAEETLVMDPIDGTSNAIAGIPYYTVSLAVGKSSMSDIRLAYLRNIPTGDVYWAEKGQGAYKNGQRIHVREPKTKELFMMIYLGNGSHPDSYDLAKRVKSSRSMGCASLEMALVAEGEADGQFMKASKYSRGVRIVDIAASTLILREAGGEVYDMEGTPLNMPFKLESRSNFVAVSKPKVFDIALNKAERHKCRYGLYANMKIPKAAEYTRQVIAALEGEDFCVDTEIALALGMEGTPLIRMEVDIVIVIGGDGTLLRALQSTDAAVVGINGGTVGFLAEIDHDHIAEGVSRLIEGDYSIESRFRLSTWYNGEYLSDSVNEVVVHTASVAKIRHYKIYVNDELASELRADGIIISTPTGSTCYAMSLGAPYMHPQVDALIIVPMAAYKFSSRPFIVPANSKITVESLLDRECLIVLDGQEEHVMAGCSKVEFKVSDRPARFVKFSSNFFTRVRSKLVNSL